MPHEVTPLVVSTAQATRLLSCSRDQIYDLINAGELISYLESNRRKITTESIRAFIRCAWVIILPGPAIGSGRLCSRQVLQIGCWPLLKKIVCFRLAMASRVWWNGLRSAPTNFQPIFKGGILILAVGMSALARRLAAEH